MIKKLVGALLFSHAAQSVSQVRNPEVISFDRVSTIQNSNGNFLVLSMDWGEQNMEINEARTRQNFETYMTSQKNDKESTCEKQKEKGYSNTI